MMLETNIDDMNPEIYSYLFEELFAEGALDVFLTDINMKKNRPGVKLSVLCSEKKKETLEKIIFKETTTFGIRNKKVNRTCLEREFVDFASSFGTVTIKKAFYNEELIKFAPEYEECKEIAKRERLPLQQVYQQIISEKMADTEFEL